ncbi:unnamed protein product [Linum trigynum]|uniref:Uncharacterized protein n=1 Tax=Linum trigynum TaxID=586398 RepID=A0AAV2FKC5_9ROSI
MSYEYFFSFLLQPSHGDAGVSSEGRHAVASLGMVDVVELRRDPGEKNESSSGAENPFPQRLAREGIGQVSRVLGVADCGSQEAHLRDDEEHPAEVAPTANCNKIMVDN